jgi:hypothetical protein
LILSLILFLGPNLRWPSFLSDGLSFVVHGVPSPLGNLALRFHSRDSNSGAHVRMLRSRHAFIILKLLARTEDGLTRRVTKSFCFLQRRCSSLIGRLWLGVWVSNSD